MRATRLIDSPIISRELHPSIGDNIQGPSLIRTPEWITSPLGKYYLYFADHKGSYIRLAYADNLIGPWTIYPPGSLQLANSGFLTEPPDAPAAAVEKISRQREESIGSGFRWTSDELPHDLLTELTTPHIASPDVHVDLENRQIVMYFHGLEALGTQVTRRAVSNDGINFSVYPEILSRSYLRAFKHSGETYALVMPGQIYRFQGGTPPLEEGPLLFNRNMRHSALLQVEDSLHVFWSQVGDTPERILMSVIDLRDDWLNWRETEPIEVLRPERVWEGSDAPLKPSVRSVAYGRVNQLRDPAIFSEEKDIYLLYSVAGESGIGIARLV
ncbi:MAG: hypothetical protein Ct9H300mP11_11000 [Chloroflexota bacterium]|nr:MAG: hypothetical protein Ct9H300mP11_11000 [Chloroflexota bacterium]